jgi:hypothetical protein
MLTLQATPIDGTLAERRRTRSGYDVPVSLTASGAVPLGAGLTVAWLARHQSGRPYAYAVTGDANADGIASNDLLFVPSRADDISLAAADQYEVLDRFIAGEACLNRQRGRIMARNSCRNPAFTTLDTRLSWAVPFSRRPLEIDIDVFNLANLLHRRWGLVRETSAGEAKTGLVSLVGWDAANNRPRYTLATSGGAYLVPARRQVLTDLSRWRMQLGARLHF